MLGLLQKDLCLLAKRKKSLIVFFIVSIMLCMTQTPSFGIGYVTMLGLILCISTLSYDEYENGYCFLMTLPIDTKLYVLEKFVMSICGIILSFLLSIIITCGATLLDRHPLPSLNTLENSIAVIPIYIFFLAILIPAHLKWGAEKSRLVIAGIAALAVAVILLLKENIISDQFINNCVNAFQSMSTQVLTVLILGFTILSIVVSYVISLKIMNKKKY